MDDFASIYSDRYQSFNQGLEQGKKQAEKRNYEDLVTEATIFGKEFGKQIALYEAFLNVFYEQKLDQTIENKKTLEKVQEIDIMVKNIKFQKLEPLKTNRELLFKNFNILMARLGIKKIRQIENQNIEANMNANEGQINTEFKVDF